MITVSGMGYSNNDSPVFRARIIFIVFCETRRRKTAIEQQIHITLQSQFAIGKVYLGARIGYNRCESPFQANQILIRR